MSHNKSILIILDGWGIATDSKRSAIDMAHTPNYKSLLATYPNSTLVTFGEEVGLPEGQMGNSEVGHINIGAGRVVYQELARINKAIREGELQQMPALLSSIKAANERSADVHLIGLVSDGGVHSHINHLLALTDIVEQNASGGKFIHAFTDGRDTAPDGGRRYLKTVTDHISGTGVEVASVIGRYYAMDRDQRWERTQRAYDLLVKGEGTQRSSVDEVFSASYEAGLTDEFIEANRVCSGQKGLIKDNDLVIFFNFRTDRPRQLTTVLTQEDKSEFGMSTLNINMVTFTKYDDRYEGITVLFEKDEIKNSLGEVLANNGKSQLRMAETEKYPHVTFFFNGGREASFENESRIVVPSPKVATYDLQPEMSAYELKDKLIAFIESDEPDFICVNFANTDMVGHTGDFDAAIKAAQVVDECLGEIMSTSLPNGYHHIIIADHGNSDIMRNEDGSPHTAHTTNLVPLIYAHKDNKKVLAKHGKLADVAPTILKLMKVDIPAEMDGKVLI